MRTECVTIMWLSKMSLSGIEFFIYSNDSIVHIPIKEQTTDGALQEPSPVQDMLAVPPVRL